MIKRQLNNIWHYRQFLIGSIKRDFAVKYQSSLLGALWSVIGPLASVLIYTIVFSKLIGAKLPGVEGTAAYGLYLCIGIIAWNLYSDITIKLVSIFLDNANFLKKLIFPVGCLPIISVCNALISFFISFLLFLFISFFMGGKTGLSAVAVVAVIIVQLIFSLGIGMLMATLNVFFRDVGQLWPILLNLWFWATPIVYPIHILPEKVSILVSLNPMTAIIGSYQSIFIYGDWPDWQALGYILLLSLFICFMAMRLYMAKATEIVDEI